MGTPTTVTPSSPPVTGMNEAVDIAKWWLGRAEVAETPPWKVRMRIPPPPYRSSESSVTRDAQVGRHGRG